MSSLGNIRITCRADFLLPLGEIVEFQGELKKRSNQDIKNIKAKILEVGFSFPFFVWQNEGKNYCLDGHGRILALIELREEGYELPEVGFPVVYIEAESEKEAKEKLLQVISSYGMITSEGLAEFTEGLSLDISTLTFADAYLDFSGNVFREEGEYSPRQNAMKIAVFRDYHIPVSDKDIAGFKERLEAYEAETGNREGFFMRYLAPHCPEKLQEINN